MIDIKIISVRDILPVHHVDIAPGIRPLSLSVIGARLNEASEVLINDIVAPEFIVLAPGKLLAQVPSSERTVPIRKITVLAEVPSTTRSSLLYFDAGPTFRRIQGIERLVQFFCKLLLQTPGSDRFDPGLGGGLLSLVGKSVAHEASSSVAAAVVRAVSTTRDQILGLQSKNANIPQDERLLSADTVRAGFDPARTLLVATVNLAAVSGKQAVANLTW